MRAPDKTRCVTTAVAGLRVWSAEKASVRAKPRHTGRESSTVPELKARDIKLIQYLNEAYGKEKQLETALQAHIGMTGRTPYKKRLQQHLRETKAHGRDVQRRIRALGGKAEQVNVPGPEAVERAATRAANLARRGLAAMQGPVHVLRGTGEQEKLLKNAKTQFQDAAEQIASYTAVGTLAEKVGDRETAQLAKRIRREEERMRDFLARQIEQLTKAVATEEIPASERSTGRRRGGRRRAATSRSRATARRATARRATPRRATARRSTARRASARASSPRRSTSRSAARSSGRRSTSRASGTRRTSGRASSGRTSSRSASRTSRARSSGRSTASRSTGKRTTTRRSTSSSGSRSGTARRSTGSTGRARPTRRTSTARSTARRSTARPAARKSTTRSRSSGTARRSGGASRRRSSS
ncbi:MAG: DUF892 family protein [Actinobacteria bacterium]|nr:MAG: DUF892 family protein [Actinomycetota bacterium]